MTEETKELQEFESQHMAVIANYALLDQQIKEAKKHKDKLKKELMQAMEKHGVKSIDNDQFKVTLSDGSTSKSIDLKAFQEKEPVEYAQLMEDYPKVITRNGSLRVTVK